MGYRSSGYLVFPEHFLPYYNSVCPDTPLDEYDAVDTIDGYIYLTFTGWKWYESYGDVSQIEEFKTQLDQWMFDQESIEDRVDQNLIAEIPEWCIFVKEISGDGTINMYKPISYVKEDWIWGYNRQGEEAEDYVVEGAAGECGLYQTRGVENPWGYQSGWALQASFDMDKITGSDEEETEQWLKQFTRDVMDKTNVSYDADVQKTWNGKWVFRVAGSDMSEVIEPVDPDNLREGWQTFDGSFINGSDKLDYDILDGETLVAAVWNDEVVVNSRGDYYEMEIYEFSVAEWSGDTPVALSPDFRGAYK